MSEQATMSSKRVSTRVHKNETQKKAPTKVKKEKRMEKKKKEEKPERREYRMVSSSDSDVDSDISRHSDSARLRPHREHRERHRGHAPRGLRSPSRQPVLSGSG